MSKYGMGIYKLNIHDTNTGEFVTPTSVYLPDGSKNVSEVLSAELSRITGANFDNKFERKIGVRIVDKSPEIYENDTSI